MIGSSTLELGSKLDPMSILKQQANGFARSLRGPIPPPQKKLDLSNTQATVYPTANNQATITTQVNNATLPGQYPGMPNVPGNAMAVMQPNTFHPENDIIHGTNTQQMMMNTQPAPGTITKKVMDEHSMFASTSHTPLRVDGHALYGKTLYIILALCGVFVLFCFIMWLYRSKSKKKLDTSANAHKVHA